MADLPSDTDIAAVLAEFEDDTDAVRTLRKTPQWEFLEKANQLRDARDFFQDYKKAAAPYMEKGFTVLRPKGLPHAGWVKDFPHFVESTVLQTPAGHEVPIELIESSPQLWVLEMSDYNAFYIKATGEEVDEFAVDWDTEDQVGAIAAKGLLHVDDVEVRRQFNPVYLCTDYGAAGLQIATWAKASRAVPPADRL